MITDIKKPDWRRLPMFVMQDGGDFYVYRDDPDAEDEDVEAERIVHYPHKVRDFDCDAAARARQWFVKKHTSGRPVHWIS